MDERVMSCPHCLGTGHVPAWEFVPGQKVWWKGDGYGYKDRIPAVVVGRTTTGKSFRIRFATSTETLVRTARLSMLAPRVTSPASSAGEPRE